MIEFIAAVYNEEKEIDDLIKHVWNYVDAVHIVDDVSTDDTTHQLNAWYWADELKFDWHQMDQHTGLPEVVKAKALEMCEPDSWVVMLDADERFADGVLEQVTAFIKSPSAEEISHIYFSEPEFIDGNHTRTFLKCRAFKKSAVKFSTEVHRDDQFTGKGLSREDWVVIHRKSRNKQIARELEYLETYRKLVKEGKITQERMNEMMGFHYFIKVPHG